MTIESRTSRRIQIDLPSLVRAGKDRKIPWRHAAKLDVARDQFAASVLRGESHGQCYGAFRFSASFLEFPIREQPLHSWRIAEQFFHARNFHRVSGATGLEWSVGHRGDSQNKFRKRQPS